MYTGSYNFLRTKNRTSHSFWPNRKTASQLFLKKFVKEITDNSKRKRFKKFKFDRFIKIGGMFS